MGFCFNCNRKSLEYFQPGCDNIPCLPYGKKTAEQGQEQGFLLGGFAGRGPGELCCPLQLDAFTPILVVPYTNRMPGMCLTG